MPKSHDQLSEKTSESGIVASLAISPLYRERPATAFDLATMLDAEELAAFVQATQPKEWAKLAKQFPGAERAMLAAQVSALVAKRGTLEVLRNGASFNGINLQLAFFKPSAGATRSIRRVTRATASPSCGKSISPPRRPTSRWTWASC